MACDVVEGRIELGCKAAVVVFAEQKLVGCMANAFGDTPPNEGFEGGGIDVVATILEAVAKGAAIVEVDVGVGLQGAVGSIGTLADGVDGRQDDFGTHGFYFAHADGVEVAEDDKGDLLGSDVAMIGAIGLNGIGSPNRVFEASGAFLVACFHHFGGLVEKRAYEIVEVVLEAAGVGTVIEDDAGKLAARGIGDGT